MTGLYEYIKAQSSTLILVEVEQTAADSSFGAKGSAMPDDARLVAQVINNDPIIFIYLLIDTYIIQYQCRLFNSFPAFGYIGLIKNVMSCFGFRLEVMSCLRLK